MNSVILGLFVLLGFLFGIFETKPLALSNRQSINEPILRSVSIRTPKPTTWIIDYESPLSSSSDQSDVDAFVAQSRRFKKSEVKWRITRYSAKTGLTNWTTHVIKNALNTWAAVIPLTFHQVVVKREKPDLVFRFNDDDYDEKCGKHFRDGELAHVPRKINGPVSIHFNGNIDWTGQGTGDFPRHDIFTVALHEIGHALGLNHSDMRGTVMYKKHSQTFEELTPDDIAGVQHLYGKKLTSKPSETAAPSTYTTTTSTNRTCNPGQYYCGRQLQSMGYRLITFFNGSFNNPEEHLFRCDTQKRGVFYTKCYESCIPNGEFDSICSCNHNGRLCGHAIQRKFNIIPPDYNARYECRNNILHLTNTCPDRCFYNSCKDTILRCNTSRLYCGVEMLESGFFRAPTAHWNFNALYNCMDPNIQIQMCPGQCVDSSCVTRFVTK